MKVGAIYFVLYIVLITELLIVITERDDAQRKLLRDIVTLNALNENYLSPLSVDIPQDPFTFFLPDEFVSGFSGSMVFVASNLVSKQEEDSVVFCVDIDTTNIKQIPPQWPRGGIRSDKDTNSSVNDKYVLKKSGKYCQLVLKTDFYDLNRVQNRLIERDNLSYQLKVHVETPRIISSNYSPKAVKLILDRISGNDTLKAQFLASLPDSTDSEFMSKFLYKNNLTLYDTLNFYNLARYKVEALSSLNMFRDKLNLVDKRKAFNSFIKNNRIYIGKQNTFTVLPKER